MSFNEKDNVQGQISVNVIVIIMEASLLFKYFLQHTRELKRVDHQVYRCFNNTIKFVVS